MSRHALLLVVLLFSGCAAPLVNIPAVPGDVASDNPNGDGVIAVEVAALRHVLKTWPPEGGAYGVELPPGTTAESYRKVVGRLPEGVTTEAQFGSPIPTFTVAQIHIRGTDARVDIVRPSLEGRPALVSVFEAVDISGWYARRMKVWNIPVDQALRMIRQTPAESAAGEAGEEVEAGSEE